MVGPLVQRRRDQLGHPNHFIQHIIARQCSISPPRWGAENASTFTSERMRSVLIRMNENQRALMPLVQQNAGNKEKTRQRLKLVPAPTPARPLIDATCRPAIGVPSAYDEFVACVACRSSLKGLIPSRDVKRPMFEAGQSSTAGRFQISKRSAARKVARSPQRHAPRQPARKGEVLRLYLPLASRPPMGPPTFWWRFVRRVPPPSELKSSVESAPQL